MQNEECRGYLNTIADLHKLHPEFAGNSTELNNYRGPLFKGLELGNLQLLDIFKGGNAAGPLPDKTAKILDHSSGTLPYVGAYPLQ